MTHNHPIWQQKYKEPAHKALSKLADTHEARLMKAPTDREKDYLHALEALFGEGTKLEADLAYAARMEDIYNKYPDDQDAAAFYSLALLGTSHGERDYGIYMKAAAVAEEVFAANPNHPGAAHYLIHSYDDPVHAPLGLRAATSYAKIAPSAAHALHMPSHIFVAMGMWKESASTNAASYKATSVRSSRLKTPIQNHHALSWLIYDLIQLGQYEAARNAMIQMKEDLAVKSTSRTRFHYAVMQAFYSLEIDPATDTFLPLTLKTDDDASIKALTHFSSGMQAIHLGKLDKAEEAVIELTNLSGTSKPDSWTKIAWVLGLELKAFIARASGEDAEALNLLKHAVDAENEMDFVFGPPRVVKPAYEALAEFYFDKGEYDNAIEAFNKTLEKRPGRSRTLMGLAKAGLKAGNSEVAIRAIAQLKENWKDADSNVTDTLEGLQASE